MTFLVRSDSSQDGTSRTSFSALDYNRADSVVEEVAVLSSRSVVIKNSIVLALSVLIEAGHHGARRHEDDVRDAQRARDDRRRHVARLGCIAGKMEVVTDATVRDRLWKLNPWLLTRSEPPRKPRL
jgi:hypothetical protein